MAEQARIGVLDEALKIYKMQRERVKLDYTVEKKIGKAFPTLSADVRLLKELLDKVEALQDEEGVLDGAKDFEELPDLMG